MQLVEVALGSTLPQSLAVAAQLIDEVLVARERSSGQHCGRRVEVVAGEGHLFVEMTNSVAERDPGVPDRVPDGTCDGFDDLGHLARLGIVNQHDVEIAERRQLTTSVSAHGDEGDAFVPRRMGRDRRIEQGAQPLVGELGERVTVISATTCAVVGGDVEQALSIGGSHRGNSDVPIIRAVD